MAEQTIDQINTSLTRLYKMRDSGVLIVRHGDTSTQFQSMTDLQKAIVRLESQLNRGLGVKRSHVTYIRQRSRGYGSNGEDL